MSQFLGHIVTLLTNPPGNLIYHIVLVFAIAGALQGAIHWLRLGHLPQERRMVIGLGVLLGLQLVLFIISGLNWRGLLNIQLILPPLDRAVTLLMLIWIVWLWVFPEPTRLGDAATLLLSLLAVAVLVLTLIFWILKPSSSFNLSVYETGWQVFSIAVALLGILGLTLRRPNGWSYGLAMLMLAFLGHFTSLVFPSTGNFPGLVRLAQLGMFPILLALSQRFLSPSRPPALPVRSRTPVEPAQESLRYSADSKTFHALMSVAAETEPAKIGQALTRGIAHTMMADFCYLISLAEDKTLAIICGYNLVREESLEGMNIDQDAVPVLANAIRHGRPLRVPASGTSSDLKSLGQILKLSNPGNLLNVPVISPERGVLGSILMLSPYSNRLWRTEDQTYLSSVTPLLVPILERGQRAAAMEIEHNRSVQEARDAMEQAAEAQKKYEETAAELEKRPAAAITTTQAKVITSLSQELHQPISSITGYTDLLLDESDGMLSALQRKFIEHIKASTEQIGGLVDDLIQASNLESGKRKNKPEPIDLNLIVDNAMAFTSAQIREKNITLRLDITGTQPRIQTDRDTLQQILIHLLQNATAATQKEGNISLRVQLLTREDSHFLSLQVTDNGGGIAPADIPRVFDRRSQAEGEPIEGLGDDEAGLSIVKSLVEAQNGRISVETEAGVGSTFSVLIPVLVESPVEN